MSTITKEFTKEQLIEQAKKNIEVLHGAVEKIPGASDAAVIHLKLAEITLASLEAEPVAYIRDGFRADGVHFCGGIISAEEHERTKPALSERYNWKHQPLFVAPPAPVAMKDHQIRELVNELRDIAVKYHGSQQLREHIARTIRAAMLQGAEPVTTANKLPAEAVYGYFAFNDHHGEEFFKKREDAIAFCKEAIEEYRQENADEGCDPDEVRRTCWGIIMQEGTDIEVDNEGHIDYALTPELDGNSPVIPDGWVLVPIEPTEDMIVNGFESEPDESFSDADVWEAYEAMSGCQQAAHRAKLCWAAMISAAPKLE
ncbi:hypothetical protein [Enterobacter roggenkampii]|uniref:hypothetical protein n=1 Tax=Enterobacter roggenkampii TaxID=1812935 RepID=UPI0025ABAD3D|nr:hypothetical protein [Enterobacter roggenkampii]WJS52100.1 hypothetical protein QU521_05545 [Enterobacter roggenkampii]